MEINYKELGISEAQLKRIINGNKPKPKILVKNISDDVFKIGIVADTHFCSIHEKLDELHTFYAIMKKDGIKYVVNAGDLVAGWGIYKGQENEVHTFGAKNQAQYVIDNYPYVKGIKTYFITGNHDLSWWVRSGIDIGELIANKRTDMIYLGQYQADLTIDGVKVRLIHPDGGGAYALSYKAQKIAEQIPSGQKPQILVFGHWHTSHYFFYRLIHIFNAGCFECQSTMLLRKGINPTIGGWTAEVRTGNDKKKTIISLTATFIPFL